MKLGLLEMGCYTVVTQRTAPRHGGQRHPNFTIVDCVHLDMYQSVEEFERGQLANVISSRRQPCVGEQLRRLQGTLYRAPKGPILSANFGRRAL